MTVLKDFNSSCQATIWKECTNLYSRSRLLLEPTTDSQGSELSIIFRCLDSALLPWGGGVGEDRGDLLYLLKRILYLSGDLLPSWLEQGGDEREQPPSFGPSS